MALLKQVVGVSAFELAIKKLNAKYESEGNTANSQRSKRENEAGGTLESILSQ